MKHRNFVLAWGLLGFSAWTPAKEMPLVAVSIRPLALLVQDICQGECQIKALIPIGQSEHNWEPGPKDIAATKSAVAAVGVGLGLDEAWFKRALASGNEGRKVIPILIGDDAQPLPWKTESQEHDQHGNADHDHGRFDPHVWFDPVRMSLVVPKIVKGLSAAMPQSAKNIELNGLHALKKLAALQIDIAKLRTGWREQPVLVSHDALGYWAERYQIKTTSLTGVGGSGRQVSAKVMAKAIREFKKAPVLAVVVERQDGAAQNLARELKVPLVVLDFAGGVDKQSYYDWLMHLAQSWDSFAKADAARK